MGIAIWGGLSTNISSSASKSKVTITVVTPWGLFASGIPAVDLESLPPGLRRKKRWNSLENHDSLLGEDVDFGVTKDRGGLQGP